MPIIFLHSPFARSLLAANAGLLGYGSWAFYANQQHGFEIGLKAAATQGIYSFVLTLSLTLGIDFLYQRLPLEHFRLFVTWLLASMTVYITSWSVNAAAGTPEIAMTILPGIVISSIYNFFYLLTLQKLSAFKQGE